MFVLLFGSLNIKSKKHSAYIANIAHDFESIEEEAKSILERWNVKDYFSYDNKMEVSWNTLDGAITYKLQIVHLKELKNPESQLKMLQRALETSMEVF